MDCRKPAGVYVRSVFRPKGAFMQFRVQSYESITSTNDVIKRAIEAGESEGMAVRALRQTAGYGRQGRAWESPVGGMYQSFLLRPHVPPAQLPTLSLLVGLAVRRAVVGLLPQLEGRVQVKWPNDLVVAWDDEVDENVGAAVNGGRSSVHGLPSVSRQLFVNAATSPVHNSNEAGGGLPLANGGDAKAGARPGQPRPFRKLGGISTEMHAKALCVGVGVNVARPEAAAGGAAQPPAGKNVPVYLAELGLGAGSVEQRIATVADALCEQLSQLYPIWCADGFAPFREEFDQHAALTGRFVCMEDLSGNVLASGLVQGVAPDGRLMLQTPEGKTVYANSGEAHIR